MLSKTGRHVIDIEIGCTDAEVTDTWHLACLGWCQREKRRSRADAQTDCIALPRHNRHAEQVLIESHRARHIGDT